MFYQLTYQNRSLPIAGRVYIVRNQYLNSTYDVGLHTLFPAIHHRSLRVRALLLHKLFVLIREIDRPSVQDQYFYFLDLARFCDRERFLEPLGSLM